MNAADGIGKLTLFGVVVLVAGLLLVASQGFAGGASGTTLQVQETPTANADDRYTICHVAGRASDPANHITLTLPASAVFGPGGHFNENGTTQAGHEEDEFGPCEVEGTATATATSDGQTLETPTATNTVGATNTPTATGTSEVTNTPTATGTSEVTNTPTATGTSEVTSTPTSTGTAEVTNTPTGTTEATSTPTEIISGLVVETPTTVVSGVQGGAELPQQGVAGVQQQPSEGVAGVQQQPQQGVAGAARLPSTGSGGGGGSDTVLIAGFVLMVLGAGLASSRLFAPRS